MDPRRLRRPVRFLLLAVLAVVVGLFLRSRPQRFAMAPDDRSLMPAYPAGADLLVRELEADVPLRRGVDVIYAVDGKAHFGRIRALGGDIVGAQGGHLTVNGETLHPAPIPGVALGRVPEDHVCILAINPFETSYPDSRRLGFIPRGDVVAVILGTAR